MEWKDILGYEGFYKISDNGEIKSIDRKILSSNGKMLPFKGKNIKLTRDKVGYVRVSLNRLGKLKFHYAHRMVAQCFIYNTENKPYVNHKNGIKNDNRVDNLEWCTKSENKKHSYDTLGELPRRGARNGMTVIDESLLDSIKQDYLKTKSFMQTGKNFNISNTQAWRIVTGKSRVNG